MELALFVPSDSSVLKTEQVRQMGDLLEQWFTVRRNVLAHFGDIRSGVVVKVPEDVVNNKVHRTYWSNELLSEHLIGAVCAIVSGRQDPLYETLLPMVRQMSWPCSWIVFSSDEEMARSILMDWHDSRILFVPDSEQNGVSFIMDALDMLGDRRQGWKRFKPGRISR